MTSDNSELVHVIVNDHGIVIEPKRWRGHPVYILYYWSLCVRHSQSKRGRDPTPGEGFRVDVWDDERAQWPALSGITQIDLRLTSDGKVQANELRKESTKNAQERVG